MTAVRAMMSPLRYLTLFVIAAGLLPAAGAQAQPYGATRQPAPLYPYAVQNSYGVQYRSSVADQRNAVEAAPKPYVNQQPAAARAYPYVGRRHAVEDAPVRSRRKPAAIADADGKRRVGRDDNKKRVIKADAEITILGPDRMSIRLFRKGQGPRPARAQ